jgi:hypothetical protein
VAHKGSKDQHLETEVGPEGGLFTGQVGLVNFQVPDNPSLAQVDLAKDIVRIDHRSLHTLPPKSKERGEVRDLLVNVVALLQSGQTEAGRSLLIHAEGVYLQHIQARNRLRYLLGMLAGVLTLSVFGVALQASKALQQSVMPPHVLPLVLLFAGMGAMTSVLTRLSSIDLRDQTSIPMVFISGMARPVTAVFFALVVSLVLALRIVDIHVGVAGNEAVPASLFLVAAFLCGFSERFAQDVLARVGGGAVRGRNTDSTIDSVRRFGTPRSTPRERRKTQ